MHIKSAASLLLIASLASAYTGDIECQQGDEALLALEHLGFVATAFCSSFLEQATITAATVTPTVTSTVTTTFTTTVRPAVKARGLDECTINQLFGYACKGATKRGERPVIPGPLVPFADPLISAACSLLGVTPGATTITVTAPATTTTTTVTVQRGNCDADAVHNGSGNGSGNILEIIVATSPLQCCQECQAMSNCVASAYDGAACQILRKIAPSPGATSDMCPLGFEDYNFGPVVAEGIVFKGPCGY